MSVSHHPSIHPYFGLLQSLLMPTSYFISLFIHPLMCQNHLITHKSRLSTNFLTKPGLIPTISLLILPILVTAAIPHIHFIAKTFNHLLSFALIPLVTAPKSAFGTTFPSYNHNPIFQIIRNVLQLITLFSAPHTSHPTFGLAILRGALRLQSAAAISSKF